MKLLFFLLIIISNTYGQKVFVPVATGTGSTISSDSLAKSSTISQLDSSNVKIKDSLPNVQTSRPTRRMLDSVMNALMNVINAGNAVHSIIYQKILSDSLTLAGAMNGLQTGKLSVESDPVYLAGIANYYSKSASDSRYLQSVPAQTWASITGKPVFFSGNYSDLNGLPVIPTSFAWSQITAKPSFATVATSGSYSDLSGLPAIPTNTNQLTNGAGFMSSIPAQTFTSLTGKPSTLSGYGITDAYPLTGNPSGYLTSSSIANKMNNTGVTDGSNATAGQVGEIITSNILSSSAVSLPNSTAINITSITLSAGDWEVSGNANFSAAAATIAGKTASISNTSATLVGDGADAFSSVVSTLVTNTDGVQLAPRHFSVSTTTIIYLVEKITFTAGTTSGFGYLIARRIR